MNLQSLYINVHARATPLNDSSFENIFVHYMPFSNEWYKTPVNSYLRKPANVFSLEDPIEADKKTRRNQFARTIRDIGTNLKKVMLTDSFSDIKKTLLLATRIVRLNPGH